LKLNSSYIDEREKRECKKPKKQYFVKNKRRKRKEGEARGKRKKNGLVS
jgi:hypothetical protein